MMIDLFSRLRATLFIIVLSPFLAGCGEMDDDVQQRTGAAPPSILEQERARQGVDLTGVGYDLGDPCAPISIVEFSDFGCHFCRQFATETFPTLEREYIETGKVRWKYIPFVLGIFPNGDRAAIAGVCAAQQGDEAFRSEEHTSELQSRGHLVCRLLLEKKKQTASRRDEPTSIGQQ